MRVFFLVGEVIRIFILSHYDLCHDPPTIGSFLFQTVKKKRISGKTVFPNFKFQFNEGIFQIVNQVQAIFGSKVEPGRSAKSLEQRGPGLSLAGNPWIFRRWDLL